MNRFAIGIFNTRTGCITCYYSNDISGTNMLGLIPYIFDFDRYVNNALTMSTAKVHGNPKLFASVLDIRAYITSLGQNFRYSTYGFCAIEIDTNYNVIKFVDVGDNAMNVRNINPIGPANEYLIKFSDNIERKVTLGTTILNNNQSQPVMSGKELYDIAMSKPRSERSIKDWEIIANKGII